jgi:hypothetical protein
MKTNKPGTKIFRFGGIKAALASPTDEQLSAINTFTRRPFTAEELLVGQVRLCNNAIDRDQERYSEECIDWFVKTIVRKTFLLNHDKHDMSRSAIGKFFAADIEKISLDQSRMEIDENLTLPEGKSEVWFLCPWFYVAKDAVSPQDLVKIEAGIYDFASIGYRCQQLVPVYAAAGAAEVLYWEYRGKSEATEGSLVYLGAQYGAGMKDFEDQPPKPGDTTEKNTQGGENTMKNLAMKLMKAFGKVFSEDEEKIFDEIKAVVDEKDTRIAALTQDTTAKDAKITELTPLAADGKAYREELVTQYVTHKAKLGEVGEIPEAQKSVKDVAAAYPVDFLRSEVKLLEARVFEKFPDTGKLKGDNRTDKTRDGKDGQEKVNPLVPKD